jgi:hypothetical protein
MVIIDVENLGGSNGADRIAVSVWTPRGPWKALWQRRDFLAASEVDCYWQCESCLWLPQLHGLLPRIGDLSLHCR